MDETEIIEAFITEAKDHLKGIEEDVLALESQGADIDSELVNHLFRAAHTIKGGAGFFSLNNIVTLSHNLENIIGLIRNNKLVPNNTISDALLKGIDKLNILLDDHENEGSVDISSEINALKLILAVKESGDGKAGKAVLPAKKKEGDGFLFDLSDVDLAKLNEKGLYLYECTLDLIQECENANLDAPELINEIITLGKIQKSIPDIPSGETLEADDDGQFLFSFLFETVIDDGDILASGLNLSPLKMVNRELVEKETKKTLPSSAAAPVETVAPTTKPVSGKKKLESTVRISVPLLDKLMDLASELVLVRNQNILAVVNSDLNQLSKISQRLNVVTSDLQSAVMQTRMQPVSMVFNKFSRVVRDLSRDLGKEIQLDIVGSDVELDKNIIEAISDPLTHLVRNAVDHGIEMPDKREAQNKPPMGRLVLHAYHQAGQVIIEIRDDGKGMDPDHLREAAVQKGVLTKEQAKALPDRDTFKLIFAAGFSTASEITDISGRGVGMDVVKQSIQNLGGVIEIDSTVGSGSSILIKLPLTLAIIPALIVMVENMSFSIPQVNITEVVWLYGSDVYQKIKHVDNQEVYWLRGEMLPILRLYKLLDVESKTYVNYLTKDECADRRRLEADRRSEEDGDFGEKRSGVIDRRTSISNSLFIVVLRVGSDQFGLVVDNILDNEEIVVKSLHKQLKPCSIYAGTTVLGNGKISPILDVTSLAEVGNMTIRRTDDDATSHVSSSEDKQPVLLFDIGGEEIFTVPLCLISRIEQINKKQLKIANQKEYIPFGEGVIPLIRLDRVFSETSGDYNDDFFVIIPKCQRPVGIAVSNIQDNIEIDCIIDTDTISRKGVVGSLLIDDKLILVLDMPGVIEIAEPAWFDGTNETSMNQKHALLVEDSSFYTVVMMSYMRGTGLQVTQAQNGKEAIEKLKDTCVDFIVSDLEMPEMDGFEFAKWLRGNEQYKDMPLIAVSSMKSPNIEETVLKAGFNSFRSKHDREGIVEVLNAL